MRIHIDLNPELVAEVDKRAGKRGRSEFIRAAVQDAVEQKRRWSSLKAAAGSIPDKGHEWDEDPAAWVRRQRRADRRRVG